MTTAKKLSEVAKFRKAFITIDDNKKYKRCRVQLHRKGIVERDFLLGKEIKTKKQRICKTDDFLVAEMDAKFGGYGIVPPELDGAIVSSHYYLFELDKTKILPEYFSVLIDTDIIKNQIKAKGSTNYSRVSPTEVADFEIPCPPIETQKKIISIYGESKERIFNFDQESERQVDLLSKLRQTIMQEAIEGKLTAVWREHNPVTKGDPEYDTEALLAKIKSEKQKMIANGEIKKEKPVSLVTMNEKPFELPESWTWVRLAETAEGFQYGSSSKSLKSGKVPVLRMGNIQSGKINWDDLVFTDSLSEIGQYQLKSGDLLFNRTNSRELVGKTALFSGAKQAIFAGYLIRFSPLGNCLPEYFNIVMNSSMHRDWCNQNKIDALGQSNINATKLRDFYFPLCPIAEQRFIVSLVEQLSLLVTELESQAVERQSQSQELLQTVLREAFEGVK